MIKVDIKRYILNRMWFGWWYSYSYDLAADDPDPERGTWRRDTRYYWSPVILIADTFTDDRQGKLPWEKLSKWARLYDPY